MLDLAVAVVRPTGDVRPVPLRRDARLVAGHASGRTSTWPSTGCGSGCRRTRAGLAAGARADRAHTWLTGSAAAGPRGRASTCATLAPIGRFRARARRVRRRRRRRAADDDRDARPHGWATAAARRHAARSGNWQSPTLEFFPRLPRDPAAPAGPAASRTTRAAGSPRSRRRSPRCAPGWCRRRCAAALYRALTGLPAVERGRARAQHRRPGLPGAGARRRSHPHRADDRPGARPVRRRAGHPARRLPQRRCGPAR